MKKTTIEFTENKYLKKITYHYLKNDVLVINAYILINDKIYSLKEKYYLSTLNLLGEYNLSRIFNINLGNKIVLKHTNFKKFNSYTKYIILEGINFFEIRQDIIKEIQDALDENQSKILKK